GGGVEMCPHVPQACCCCAGWRCRPASPPSGGLFIECAPLGCGTRYVTKCTFVPKRQTIPADWQPQKFQEFLGLPYRYGITPLLASAGLATIHARMAALQPKRWR